MWSKFIQAHNNPEEDYLCFVDEETETQKTNKQMTTYLVSGRNFFQS